MLINMNVLAYRLTPPYKIWINIFSPLQEIPVSMELWFLLSPSYQLAIGPDPVWIQLNVKRCNFFLQNLSSSHCGSSLVHEWGHHTFYAKQCGK